MNPKFAEETWRKQPKQPQGGEHVFGSMCCKRYVYDVAATDDKQQNEFYKEGLDFLKIENIMIRCT